MPNRSYSDEELQDYFNDPARRRAAGSGARPNGAGSPADGSAGGERGFLGFHDPKKAQAARALAVLLGAGLVVVLGVFVYLLTLQDELPSFEQLDNPELQLATVAYTADGQELARYAFQNRSWAAYDEISPHVVNALLATEDRRFYEHWGVDAVGILAALTDIVTEFDLRGASTVTQQLARNLYNDQIGREVTVDRKLKEMVTAVQLERRYTKPEIIEMYLNTVEYVYNAFGIEAAARTFFDKPASRLEVQEAALLVGMLQNPSLYNPIRFPENALRRRNQVLANLAAEDYITREESRELQQTPLGIDFNSSSITASVAPHFAQYVRDWLEAWGERNDVNVFAEGLVVHTTLDARMQAAARLAVEENMDGLQDVVDYEWSRPSGYGLGTEIAPYTRASGYEPWEHFWTSKRDLVDTFVKETARYKSLRNAGTPESEALTQLRGDEAFMDSLRTNKTRLEAGLVALDPRNGAIKAWVGGRNLEEDWNDHVAGTRRQPGSTFKPFVYTAAIDNDYPPNYLLPDSTYTWRNPETGEVWRPSNFGGSSGELLTLSEALATSNNLITARVITQLVNPQEVAFYARRMGIQSPLDPVPALGLGTSDVSLLELAAAYSTLASGGLYHEPVVVTRIEDRNGNVLYEDQPAPREALSERTAYTVVDMLRGTVNHPRGTAQRLNYQYGLREYDLAAKTGTTQNAADGWLMAMHPELVTGAWVGFNDRRLTFRSNFWGQGAHNALFLVGDFLRRVSQSEEIDLSTERFPTPEVYGRALPAPGVPAEDDDEDRGRTGW